MVAVALAALGATWPAAAPAAGPVRLTARFDHGARLGSSAAMYVGLAIDSRRLPSPVTAIRMLYPKGLGLITSGLGLAACERPAGDFQQVLIGGSGLGGCPRNAVLGLGSARAEVRFLDGRVVPETASLMVLSGQIADGALDLVVLVDGEHPFGAHLAYAGKLTAGHGRYGGALDFQLPAIPEIAQLAKVAVVDLRLAIGSPAIVYVERHRRRRTRYHPDGVGVPTRCPRHGFPFRVQLAFADGGHAAAETAVGCPRAAPSGG